MVWTDAARPAKLATFLTILLAVAASPLRAQEQPSQQVRVVRPVTVAKPTPEPRAEPTPEPAPPPAQQPPVAQVRPTIMRPMATRPILEVRQPIGTEIVPPLDVKGSDRPESVTLRAGATSSVMGGLRVQRQLSIADIRRRPTIMVQNRRFDFQPLLSNPKALPNVAQKLRALPQIADVLADDTQIYEVDQGLVVQNFMAYRLKSGVCANAAKRASVQQAGLSCLTRMTDAARAAAYADPSDPRYIANPGLRSREVIHANGQAALADAALADDIATLRAVLADPAQRAQVVAEVGEEEASRLATLSDEQLKEEMANSAETKIEQVMFVPIYDEPGARPPSTRPPPIPQPQNVEYQLDRRIFLTGFTLGHKYEWRQRIETSIKWCLVDCTKTYYVEASAGFNYAFGLRFPIAVTGKYAYHQQGGAEQAEVTPEFAAIDGSPADYAASGLDASLIHDGKELVAEFGVNAGFHYKIPTFVPGGVDQGLNVDFTQYLPYPFKGGQLQPPSPGGQPLSANLTFEQVDLLAGRANFGVVGVKVMPAIQLSLVGDGLTMKLRDASASGDVLLDHSGMTVPLAVSVTDHGSRFSIGDPAYSVHFDLTPGLDARAWVDVAVWSKDWDWFVWFPALKISVPSDGISFECHDGTVCARDYVASPAGVSDTGSTDGSSLGFPYPLVKWGKAFEDKYIPQCADDPCHLGIRFVKLGYMFGAMHQLQDNPALTVKSPQIATYLAKADAEAKPVLDDSFKRMTKDQINSFFTVAYAFWTKDCADKQCLKDVGTLIFFAKWEAQAQQEKHPDWSTTEIVTHMGLGFQNAAKDAVAKSKARVAAEEAALGPH